MAWHQTEDKPLFILMMILFTLFTGHQLNEPMGFSGGLEQQFKYYVIWLVKLL